MSTWHYSALPTYDILQKPRLTQRHLRYGFKRRPVGVPGLAELQVAASQCRLQAALVVLYFLDMEFLLNRPTGILPCELLHPLPQRVAIVCTLVEPIQLATP